MQLSRQVSHWHTHTTCRGQDGGHTVVVYYDDTCLPRRQGTHKASPQSSPSPTSVSQGFTAVDLFIFDYVCTFVYHIWDHTVPVYLSIPVPPYAYVSMCLCTHATTYSSIRFYGRSMYTYDRYTDVTTTIDSTTTSLLHPHNPSTFCPRHTTITSVHVKLDEACVCCSTLFPQETRLSGAQSCSYSCAASFCKLVAHAVPKRVMISIVKSMRYWRSYLILKIIFDLPFGFPRNNIISLWGQGAVLTLQTSPWHRAAHMRHTCVC